MIDGVDSAYRLTAESSGGCACLFDFDGTLAAIRDDPQAVWPVPGAVAALSELTGLVGKVAIISARPVDFLRSRLPDLPEVALYGLYGLEWQLGDGARQTHPDAAPYEPVMARLAALAESELPEGAFVEYKRISVALHYRRAPQLRESIERWAAKQAAEHALALQAGRMVVELKPPCGRDKGNIVTEQITGLSGAWYFGDDISDIKAFAALDERQRTEPAFLGVRVAVANPETGGDLRRAADLCVDAPEGVPDLLNGLIGALRGRD